MLDVPIEDLISLLFIMLAVLMCFAIAMKSYKVYREDKQTSTILVVLTATAIASAMIFLVLEKIFLSDLAYNEYLGMNVFGLTATIISGFGVVFAISFAVSNAYPEKLRLSALLSAIVTIIYICFWILDPTRHVECTGIPESCEIVFDYIFGLGFSLTQILPFCTIVPLQVIPVGIFFHYAFSVRNSLVLGAETKSKRCFILGFGSSALATGYIIELIGIDPIITTIFRSFFLIASVLIYWALFKVK